MALQLKTLVPCSQVHTHHNALPQAMLLRSNLRQAVTCTCTTSPQSRSPQHTAGAATAAAAAAAEFGTSGQLPPDVAPDVLLFISTELQQHDSLAPVTCNDSASALQGSMGQQHQQPQPQPQQQQQQPLPILIPRTSSRLQGLGQLPGFIPSLAPQPDPQLVVWQQEALEAWHSAAAWVQQQQQHIGQLQQQQHQQQGRQQQEPSLQPWEQHATPQDAHTELRQTVEPWQQLLDQAASHWAPLAAVLQAAGPYLEQQQLLQLTTALHALVQTAEGRRASSTPTEGISSTSSSTSTPMAGSRRNMFVPDVITVTVADGTLLSDAGELPVNVSRHSSGEQVRLESKGLLPQLCQLLLVQLQPLQQQQQQEEEQEQEEVDAVTRQEVAATPPIAEQLQPHHSTSVLPTSAAVKLLQQLAGLHGAGCVGPADPDLVEVLVSHHIRVEECSLHELATLLSSCARLGHPHKASWLQTYVSTAQDRLAEAAAADGAAAASSTGDLQAFTAVVAQLMDAVARYPGPHADTSQLKPFLDAVQPHLAHATPADIQTLGAAVAALKLKPGAAWRHAVVAAAHSKLPSCSMQQLVQLLLGVTAGGFNPKEHWWRSWFAATMRKCEGLLGPQTGPECVASPPESAAAATATDASAEGDSASIASVSSSSGAATPAAEGTSSSSSHSSDRSPGSRQGPGMSEVKAGAGAGAGGASSTRQWQRRLQPGDLLPAALLSTVCMVLLQLGRQVHPLWMAAMLEAHKRSTSQSELASTPQLLLLCSRLLESPPAFAVRYKPLMLRLLEPMQLNFNLLNPEQMAQAAEVCAVYRLNISVEWYRWHGAAILRLGKTFPLEALARVREAYLTQEVPTEQLLQQLLDTVPWRLQRQQDVQRQEDRLAAKKAMIGFKMDQRRRQNEMDAAKKAAKSSRSVGMGLKGPGGRADWRKRKLKPPGTLGRKF